MKNKTKKPVASSAIPKCTSIVMGGALRCILEVEHTVHSTKTKRGGQFTTWAPLTNGKLHVTSYSLKGKKMGKWDEDAPEARDVFQQCNCEGEDWEHNIGTGGCVVEQSLICHCKAGKFRMHMVGADGCSSTAAVSALDAKKSPTEVSVELAGASLSVSIDNAPPVVVRSTAAVESTVTDAAVETRDMAPEQPPAAESQETLICGYPRHPAAALFQLLEGEQLTALADSIEANGQRDRIVLVTVGGKTSILDGSNRGVACEMRGIKPQFVSYEGPKDMASLIAYSMDKNKHRRHQEPSVLAMVAVDAGQLLGRGNPGDREAGRSAGLMTQAEAGKRVGVSERLVRKAKAVHDRGTAKLNDAVRRGKLALDGAVDVAKLPAAKQDEIADRVLAKAGQTKSGHVRALARQEERRDVVAKINNGQVPALSELGGAFGVLLWDPPWEYENSDDHPSARGHIKYPSMCLEELVSLGREALAQLRDDAVIVTWATNPRMPVAVHLIEALGLTWQSMGTWVKDRIGVAPTNMRSRTEHYIIATKGSPTHTLNEVSTWLGDRPLERTEHSAKPPELHELIEQHCAGPFLELFARGPRETWTTWGAEAEKFASEAA